MRPVVDRDEPDTPAVNADVTAVIVVLIGGEALARCYQALAETGVNVIVAYPDGRIEFSEGDSAGPRDVPSRRYRAAKGATSKIVAFVEDTVEPAPGWASFLRRHLADGSRVAGVGGPVNIASSLDSRSAALAAAEFGTFQLGPSTKNSRSWRQTRRLPGVNMAFRRDLLLEATNSSGRLVEGEVVSHLRRQGWKFLSEPTMMVTYKHNHHDGAALVSRYFHGRLYSARILSSAGLFSRAAAIMKVPFLPVVLSWRTFRYIPSGVASRFRTGLCIVAQQAAWSLGEFAGALSKRAANDFSRWT